MVEIKWNKIFTVSSDQSAGILQIQNQGKLGKEIQNSKVSRMTFRVIGPGSRK